MKKTHALLSLGAAATVALAGCSTKGSEEGSGGDSDLKYDVGITEDEIKLGVLTDTSGVFKAVGLNLTQGNELWAEDINAQGGICDREIALTIQDHGYKPDNAISLYDQTKTDVVGFMQILGSPIIAALKGKLDTDNVMAVIATQSTMNLDVDEVMMIASSYDIEMVNGLSWAKDQGMIADGGKIAHIYVDSEYGQNGLMGSKYWAEQNGVEVVPVAVSAADTDMTTTVTKIKNEGVDMIALTTAPAATGSIALQNQAQGLNLPLLGNDPVFASSMLSDPTLTAALENLHVMWGGEPFAGDSEQSKKLQESWNAKYPGEQPGYGVPAGYLEALVWEAILTKACENGDMTREGLLEARLSLDDVDAKGLSDNMDLTDPGQPPVRSAYVLEIDAATPGGQKIVDGPVLSEDAKAYKTPHQQD